MPYTYRLHMSKHHIILQQWTDNQLKINMVNNKQIYITAPESINLHLQSTAFDNKDKLL